jgi:hypothetical protein
MAATITKLTPKAARLRQDQAEEFRSVLQEIEARMDLPVDLMRTIYTEVEKRTASRRKWTFIMLSPEQNATVVEHLITHSERPLLAVRLWALCFKHLRTDTGEILLSREEIADKMGQPAKHISSLMSELEKCGAIIRHREKVAGMKGRGLVRYFMNPRVATHLSGAERDNAQDGAPPLLTLMQGGKSLHNQAP